MPVYIILTSRDTSSLR